LETLQDLSSRRNLSVYLGNPYDYARENPVAVTYAPVPSFQKFSEVAELHSYPWLRPPNDKNIQSFSVWRAKLG
jgi:deoxyribodipyrimidine photo-lyase